MYLFTLQTPRIDCESAKYKIHVCISYYEIMLYTYIPYPSTECKPYPSFV